MSYKSLKYKQKILKVVVITIAWQVVAIAYAYYMHAFLITMGEGGEFAVSLSLWRSIFYTFLSATFAGLVVGSAEVFFVKKLFRKKPFFVTVIGKSLLYFVLMLAIFYLVLAIYASGQQSVTSGQLTIFQATSQVFLSSSIVFDLIFWALVMILTFIFLQFSEKFGPGGLSGYIFGKYHRPHKETRIFMFLDLRDSTAIAEKLGHVQYFSFLNDFFTDVADSVMLFKGEIYQYVGDEVVVSWKLDDGLKNANFVRCWFDIQQRIRKRKETYQDKYEIVPRYKAGFFHGEVTAGQIGAMKKEVVFTGDVLNTGSRIQEKCNFYGVDNLIHKGLLKFIDFPSYYTYRFVDTLRLKGKKSNIELYTLCQPNQD